jgi:hypothetical protein
MKLIVDQSGTSSSGYLTGALTKIDNFLMLQDNSEMQNMSKDGIQRAIRQIRSDEAIELERVWKRIEALLADECILCGIFSVDMISHTPITKF